ncbi:uncharacterized protein LOC117222164 [Megalopta genalis]|uniref:uncharacterized protein LOC117222164 n=1 Tax=Megalopta genalis TaxID=115081 RepID=UPI001442F71D|nr:DNA ligase 1-like [Megalopta genalis]
MAPRKIVKHAVSEVADKVAEAGDISLTKKKKTATKSANKSDEEKPIRLPRAAKSAKVEQIETVNAAKTVKPASKTTTAKSTSTNKKHKQAEENTVTELAKTKSGKAENADHPEIVAVKRKKQANTEAAAKVKLSKKKAQVDDIEQEENMVAKRTIVSSRDTPMKQRLRPNSIKNKENSTIRKKPTRTRGKTAKRNVDDELTEVTQKAQEKITMETVIMTKKGRGRKRAATKEENGDTEGKKTSNSTEMIVSNNNVQKSLDESDKKDDSEKQDTNIEKQEYEATVSDEIDEDNVQSALIKEEEEEEEEED